jgi:hypothetical protein
MHPKAELLLALHHESIAQLSLHQGATLRGKVKAKNQLLLPVLLPVCNSYIPTAACILLHRFEDFAVKTPGLEYAPEAQK